MISKKLGVITVFLFLILVLLATGRVSSVPDTCNDLGFECGVWDDGEGNTIDCGDCCGIGTCENGTCKSANCPMIYAPVCGELNGVVRTYSNGCMLNVACATKLYDGACKGCWISDVCTDSKTVMKLSNITNAHGELYDQENYDYYLCCENAGIHSCSGSNKVIGLSSVTNAHAEIPENSVYSEDVCFGELECVSATECSGDYSIEMISLSNNTNAHIGGFNEYETKICCASETAPIISPKFETYYWADSSGPISVSSVLVGVTEISMVFENSGLPEGTEVEFEIREDDLVFDDDIRTGDDAITGIVDSEGNIEATWLVTQKDLDKTDDYGEFYFNVQLGTSNNLELIILESLFCIGVDYCMNYETQSECENDVCGVASDSVQEIDTSITCGNGYDCMCSWVEIDGQSSCGASFTSSEVGECGNGIIEIGEQCDLDKWGLFDENDCDKFGDFDGGILSCDLDTCLFDTSKCEGGSGESCGDNEIMEGEQCEGDDYWGSISSCNDFDAFTDGDLECNDCFFDTSNCEKEIDDNLGSGFCFLNQESDDDCEDGIYEYSWKWEWVWNL